MNINNYEFNIDDEVITVEGEIGKIVDICKCDRCEERDFYEPIWVREIDGDKNYITFGDASCGFNGFYKIGSYRFHDFDKYEVLHNISFHKKELKRLEAQLALIRDLESK